MTEIHSVLENIKILHCLKCNRTCPSFEDINDIVLRNNGAAEILTKEKPPCLFNVIDKSEIRKYTDLNLSKKFKNSDVYKCERSKNCCQKSQLTHKTPLNAVVSLFTIIKLTCEVPKICSVLI